MSKKKSAKPAAGKSCCSGNAKVKRKESSGLLSGIGYALMPHIGCIAFIAGSILGVTLLTELFRPLLMNRWFFHILIAISIGFATLSSALYLRKHGMLSASGARQKWQYLSTMYGSTIGINLILFLLVFPMLANVSAAQVTGAAVAGAQGAAPAGDSVLQMSVDIPCPGHAPLITGELKTLAGVQSVVFSFPNVFDVTYDSTKVTKAQMLALDVFREYPATVLSEGKAEGVVVTGAATTGTLAPSGSGVQEVTLYVQGGNYYPNPVRVKKGIPVKLVADMNRLSGCSTSIVMPDFGVRKVLSAADNVIEFTPTQSGTFSFSCSMGMYRGTIVVEEADGTVAAFTGNAPKTSGGSCGGSSGGGCGCGGAG
jgi:copper chaperone CopZ